MTPYTPRTALIVVDLQNDFADPNGSLYVAGGEGLIEPINREVTRALETGSLVVYTQDWHPESTPHFSKDGGIWPVHCVGGTWGARFHPDLKIDGPVIRKGTGPGDGYSGFSSNDANTGERSVTELAAILEQNRIDTLVIVGLALDYCVQATAIDARHIGLRAAVRLDLTRAVDLEPGDGARAVEALRAAGVRVVEAAE